MTAVLRIVPRTLTRSVIFADIGKNYCFSDPDFESTTSWQPPRTSLVGSKI